MDACTRNIKGSATHSFMYVYRKNRTTLPVMASPNKALIQSLYKIANISPANTFGMHIWYEVIK